MLWKIGGALLIALLASIITAIAGVLSDARSGTVMLRALFAFAVSGFGLVFGILIMERYGIPFYMSKHKEEQSDLLKLYLMLKEMEKEEQSEESTESEPQKEQTLLDVSITDDILSDNKEAEEGISEEQNMENSSTTAVSGNEEGKHSSSEAMESLTEEELESLTSETENEESLTEADKNEAQMAEEKAPTFAPLSADNMTRLAVSGEATT